MKFVKYGEKKFYAAKRIQKFEIASGGQVVHKRIICKHFCLYEYKSDTWLSK